MVIISDFVLQKKAYIIPTSNNYINLAINQNYNKHIYINDDDINCYPKKTSKYDELLELISKYNNCPINNILLTHGSGEGLKLILNTFFNYNTKLLIPVPNYPGFIHDAELKTIHINKIYFDGIFEDILTLEDYIIENDVIYLSSPNLPLGYELNENNLINLITKYSNKLFIIDEAYGEYGNSDSYVKYINLENIIITKTFSKAFALAGARLGYIICNKKLMDYLMIPYCTKTVTNISINFGLNVMQNLDYYTNNVNNDLKDWKQFYLYIKSYINHDDIIHDISYNSGAYCLLYTKYPEYIVNIFKKHGYLIRNKSDDIKSPCVRISLAPKQIMDNITILIKKINGYYIYDTYYIDIDETIRENANSNVFPGIQNAINNIRKKSKVIMITNSNHNYDNIVKYLEDNNINYDDLITPLKDYNMTDIEFNNGWFIRNEKIFIIKFPIISNELYGYIYKYKHIYIIETSITENKLPFTGTFINILNHENIDFTYTIIGKENMLISNITPNSIILGDSIIDYKFAYINNIFHYHNDNPKKALDFLNHKAILALSNDHTKLLRMLYKLIEVFKILNLSYWADCGTLLGAVRYNKILPWDEDCDLGILKKDEDLLINNVELFKQHNLRIQKNKSTKEYWQIDTLYNDVGPIDPDLHIDIFLFIEINDKLVNADYRFQNPDFEIGHCNLFYLTDELFPLTTLPFYEIDIPVPNKYDQVLKRSIGNDYLYNCLIKKYINETDIKLLHCNLDNKFNNKYEILFTNS